MKRDITGSVTMKGNGYDLTLYVWSDGSFTVDIGDKDGLIAHATQDFFYTTYKSRPLLNLRYLFASGSKIVSL